MEKDNGRTSEGTVNPLVARDETTRGAREYAEKDGGRTSEGKASPFVAQRDYTRRARLTLQRS